MNKEFITYTQALALKDLGYDGESLATIDQTGYVHINKTKWPSNRGAMVYNTIHCPLLQQAFRFFRKKYNYIDFGFGKIFNGTDDYHFHINLKWEYFQGTYEESQIACLDKLIKLVKIKK